MARSSTLVRTVSFLSLVIASACGTSSPQPTPIDTTLTTKQPGSAQSNADEQADLSRAKVDAQPGSAQTYANQIFNAFLHGNSLALQQGVTIPFDKDGRELADKEILLASLLEDSKELEGLGCRSFELQAGNHTKRTPELPHDLPTELVTATLKDCELDGFRLLLVIAKSDDAFYWAGMLD